MLLGRREDVHGLDTGINTRELARTSRMVSRLTGYAVQPNKAIVGRNAFAHESGIHQDGVLKERTTYEIMDATEVGLESNSIVLGKHSGRHALRDALEQLGFKVEGNALNPAFKALQGGRRPQEAGDRARPGGDRLRRDARARRRPRAGLVRGRGRARARAAVARVAVTLPSGEESVGESSGDGPVDAIFRAIQEAAEHRVRAAPVHGRGGDRGRGRARRGDRDAARRTAAWPPARASPPTSSRPRRAPTCGRCPTRWRARRSARPRRRPPRPRSSARPGRRRSGGSPDQEPGRRTVRSCGGRRGLSLREASRFESGAFESAQTARHTASVPARSAWPASPQDALKADLRGLAMTTRARGLATAARGGGAGAAGSSAGLAGRDRSVGSDRAPASAHAGVYAVGHRSITAAGTVDGGRARLGTARRARATGRRQRSGGSGRTRGRRSTSPCREGSRSLDAVRRHCSRRARRRA